MSQYGKSFTELPFSTLRESRGCETKILPLILHIRALSVLSASRGGVRLVEMGLETETLRTFSTLRESRGCETAAYPGRWPWAWVFQYSPRVEGV